MANYNEIIDIMLWEDKGGNDLVCPRPNDFNWLKSIS